MSEAPQAVVSDSHALGMHAHAPANGIAQFTDLPVSNDPTVARYIDNTKEDFKRDFIQSLTESLTKSLTQSLTESLTKSLTQSLTEVITQSTTTIRQDIAEIRHDIAEIRQGNAEIRQSIARLGEDNRRPSTNMNALKEEFRGLSTDINELKEEFRMLGTSIAVRDTNKIARKQNNKKGSQPNYELMPLFALFTNTPIANFPKSISQFQKLKDATVMQILQELDDPFHKPNYGTPLEKRQRLATLIGIDILLGYPLVMGPAADAANGANAAEAAAEAADDDDDDDDDDNDE
ncbi:hypothetical protein O1611_g4455 [Lasiodiplodia mahajangana]|uniref:Uncharacterized protein n=1 Tax=Lasiodiplodia mahajangana TaxID=1108764 RepID=A0ACC2JNX4_9PEZI|nr:hypothetical protein O1611_g4455 [Lasiodiplodia mahajangana]